MKIKIAVFSLLGAALLSGAAWLYAGRGAGPSGSSGPDLSGPLVAQAKDMVAAFRKTIVLLDGEAALSAPEREAAGQVGQILFHDNQARGAALQTAIVKVLAQPAASRFDTLGGLLNFIETDASLFDADRLAFRELLQAARTSVAADASLPAIRMHKRISEDIDALTEIERNYDKEISQVFGRFEQRAIVLKREHWGDYVQRIKGIYAREKILKDYGVVLADLAAIKAAAPEPKGRDGNELYGTELPPKTVVLSFDDGPHRQYSEEIAAILKQYNAPGVFFSVGQNIGSINAEGKAVLNAGGKVSQKLSEAGYTLANHSFSHAQLSKEKGAALQAEIFQTDTLLKAVDAKRAPLFRFPYGAHNTEGMSMLASARLKSVMWNIDSLDWADPVPKSIAERVLRTVEKEGRGIILFHDIHERSVKALPLVLDRLVAEGYQFAGWDGSKFTVSGGAANAPVPRALATGYGDSWAIVVGINDYAKWPKLQYAVQDAQGVRQVLIEKFGFAPERVFSLKNGEATRAGILAAFHDKLAHGGVQKNDRIFVFFAGHGATRQLSSGRTLGYIVPADSDPNDVASDAIPMSEIQNIAESLAARHVLFVMDACYSGLGLTRGGGGFLRENAKRIGRQMLTAGGADQMVADGGPNGHSVFTWTLLQGLGGKADLNGDGLITATELAAFVAPAVSNVSNQTPAFGSLPGSEGGDFVFELPAETEFISTQTTQLSNQAIAMNTKLEAPPAGPVPVKNLQGEDKTVTPPAAVPQTARQLAQRANDRGLQLYKEKQYEAAEAQFTEALKLNPGFALAANNLGFVFYKQSKFLEAARWFDNAIKIDPSRAIAYLNLGDALAHGSDNVRAKQAYETFLELAPTSAAASYAKQQRDKL